MQEIWKDIKGYEGLYQVSNLGRIKSLNYRRQGIEKIKKQTSYNGYKKIILNKSNTIKTFFVHRLVAQAFIPNPKKLVEINHKDNNKANNNINNLEWCNRNYNINYGNRNEKVSTALRNKGKKIDQYDYDYNFIRSWSSISTASRALKINKSNISLCCNNLKEFAGGYRWSFDYNTSLIKKIDELREKISYLESKIKKE